MAEPFTHRGAGILFVTPTGKALFLKRGPGGDAPGAWCFPGGTMEGDETPEQTAVRESNEELGSFPNGKRAVHVRAIVSVPSAMPVDAQLSAIQPAQDQRVDFTTFIQHVAEEFAPQINGEHTGWAWAAVTQPPEPLHPGCRIAIDRLSWDELGVARAMMAGQLTSPQLYGNVHLFDMRITGTGVAYRGPKIDDKGNEINPAELVYRRPENYLTEEFLARCNGLQVIMMHPARAMLTSKEFGARTVGAMMLPYIKGDEVWGIAKVYDDAAVKALMSSQMSTSPAVLLGNGDQKLKTEDGLDLLIEGKPSLLDHLAICERGVWDKGGDPSGVRTDNHQGDTDMTKEQLEALNKQIGEMVAAAVPGAITTALAARADADGGQKLDKVLSAIDAFMGKMDSFGKRMDAHEKRMDADDEDADDKPARKDGESDEDFKKRSDAFEAKEKADADDEKAAKEKADADAEMIAADKAKKDADEDDKKKADAARADSDRLVAATTDIAKRLIKLEQTAPRQLTDEDRQAFSAAQARADEVYSAFGKRAPSPLVGEDVFPYRRRLAANLKEHSPAWAPVDVIAIKDEQTFEVAERMIFKDSALAALHPVDLKDDELREIVRTDSLTGVRTVEFRGKHSFVRSLTRPSRHVRSIGVRKDA